ncbi:MAG: translation initiation factor IF-3 [Patescibacteria group bacterium]|nr:translation initiation factor IF-3 [Patescibacteria group bacterium]
MRTPYRRNFHRPVQNTNRRIYATNLRIEAPELRVITANGEQLGIMSRQEALEQAQAQGLDLVLIAEKAQPPVAKIIDFKKFLYQEEKKAKEAKKGIKKSIVKDIKLSLFIAPGDKERLLEKGREFLEEGNQLRLNLTLRGREVMKKDMAIQMLTDFIAALGEVNIAKPPTVEGRVVRSVVSRKK